MEPSLLKTKHSKENTFQLSRFLPQIYSVFFILYSNPCLLNLYYQKFKHKKCEKTNSYNAHNVIYV